MKYFPVLLSKQGEIIALQRLAQNVKVDISPVIEVLPGSLEDLSEFLTVHWIFAGNQIILDFSLYGDFSTASIRDIRVFFTGLFRAGVNAMPAVQKNSPTNYSTLVATLIAAHGVGVCIRASNQSGGFVTYNADINALVALLNTTPANTTLLVDLGYAQANNFAILASVAVMAINLLRPTKNHWADIVVAASAFPENLTPLTARATPHTLQRFEWDMWQTVRAALPTVKYGDFGTKYPFYSEAPFAGTISVKYTGLTHFIIYRGELTDRHADGHGQYITHAHNLINSAYYSGANFSWGDFHINRIAHENIADARRKTGSPATWVQYSQNHHITLLHSII